MSISDRLDQIEARADAAAGPRWEVDPFDNRVRTVPGDRTVCRTTSLGNASLIAAARTDVPALVAALRAVLNLHQFYDQCDEGCCRYCESCEHEWPCPTVRTIAAAFGCGDGIDTTPERVHETPNREHIEEGQ